MQLAGLSGSDNADYCTELTGAADSADTCPMHCNADFSLWFGISIANWTYLDGELDASNYIHGTEKSYKYDLTNLLVPLIMLSHNHQNHKTMA